VAFAKETTMNRKRWTVLLALVWFLAAGSAAYAILGIPFYGEVITGTTVQVKGINTNICRDSMSALVQVASNSIYYSFASLATPMWLASNPWYYAATGDVIEVGRPSLFRMWGVNAGVTWNVMSTCFVR
jgi:hypothetical protein